MKSTTFKVIHSKLQLARRQQLKGIERKKQIIASLISNDPCDEPNQPNETLIRRNRPTMDKQ